MVIRRWLRADIIIISVIIVNSDCVKGTRSSGPALTLTRSVTINCGQVFRRKFLINSSRYRLSVDAIKNERLGQQPQRERERSRAREGERESNRQKEGTMQARLMKQWIATIRQCVCGWCSHYDKAVDKVTIKTTATLVTAQSTDRQRALLMVSVGSDGGRAELVVAAATSNALAMTTTGWLQAPEKVPIN